MLALNEIPSVENDWCLHREGITEILKTELLSSLDIVDLEIDPIKAFITPAMPLMRTVNDLPEIPEASANNTFIQIQKIKDAARLIHWCLSPVYYGVLFAEEVGSKSNAEKDIQEASARDTFKTILDTFVVEYQNYLEEIGFKLIYTSNQAGQNGGSFFSVNQYMKIEAPFSLFVKSFSEGVIVLELKFRGNQACMNIYCIENLKDAVVFASLASWSHSDNIHRHVFRSFTEECSKIRNSIHLNSFSYEYQVSLAIKFLEGSGKGMFKEDGVLTSNDIDLISTMQSISKYYSNLPQFSNSHLIRITHKIVEQRQMDAVQMLKYVRKQPGHFGVRLMAFNNRVTSAFKCLTHEIPPQIFDFLPCKVYLVMLLENDDTNTGVHMFLLYETEQKSNSHKKESAIALRVEKLEKYATSILGNLYNQALRFYSRDSLWRRLCDFAGRVSENNAAAVTDFTLNDFLILSTRYSSQAISHYDRSIEDLLNFELPWHNVLTELVAFYRKHIVFHESRTSEPDGIPKKYMHVILLNPANSDLLVYFLLDVEKNLVTANAVSREWRNQDVLDSAKGKAKKILQAEELVLSEECHFISDIIRTLSFILLIRSRRH